MDWMNKWTNEWCDECLNELINKWLKNYGITIIPSNSQQTYLWTSYIYIQLHLPQWWLNLIAYYKCTVPK